MAQASTCFSSSSVLRASCWDCGWASILATARALSTPSVCSRMPSSIRKHSVSRVRAMAGSTTDAAVAIAEAAERGVGSRSEETARDSLGTEEQVPAAVAEANSKATVLPIAPKLSVLPWLDELRRLPTGLRGLGPRPKLSDCSGTMRLSTAAAATSASCCNSCCSRCGTTASTAAARPKPSPLLKQAEDESSRASASKPGLSCGVVTVPALPPAMQRTFSDGHVPSAETMAATNALVGFCT
mmetsp:Transcript_107436/g.272611  ORF Transcript_107436/g.272611 Transcript_107436/m.272611 type:complete len:242 (+) Transcript_107436:834-1559(+)